MAKSLWNRDMIGDAELLLGQANKLWYEQDDALPDKERISRAKEIDGLLAEAEERIAEIRSALSRQISAPANPAS